MFVNNVTDYGCWFKCSMFNNAAYSYIVIFLFVVVNVPGEPKIS